MTVVDGKEFIGIVVDSQNDPEKMGRYKVAVPSLAGPKVNKDDLAWLQSGSQGNHEGAMSFDRPPQEGTMVSIYFPHGSGGINGIPRHIYNGIHKPTDLPSNNDLTKILPWAKEALNFKPKHKGFPKNKQTKKSNDTGAEKITADKPTESPVSSMAERLGLPTSLVSKAFVSLYDKVSSVSTAKTPAAGSMTPELGAMIPGDLLNMANILSGMTGSNKKKTLASMPSAVAAGLQSFAALAGGNSPESGTNFSQPGTRMNPETAIGNITSALHGIANFGSLEDVLHKIKTDSSIHDIANIAENEINIKGAFGNMKQKLKADGSLSLEIPKEIENLIKEFESLISGIFSTTGGMLSNSKIPTNIERLPVDIQGAFKAKLEEIPGKIGGAIGASSAFFGG